MEFPEGWGGGGGVQFKKPSMEGVPGMDIFWNNTNLWLSVDRNHLIHS